MKAIALFAVGLLLCGCAIHDRPPHAFLPPIVEEYYVCSKCGSLHGGIYGKGPLAYFRSPGAATCIHDWVRITRTEFQQRAQTRFPGQWAATLPFFRQP